MRKTKNRNLEESTYIEKHHIFPYSIFKINNGRYTSKYIVKLTAREHFVARHLLWKYYQKKYGDKDYRTKKMLYAFWQMKRLKNKFLLNSHWFEMAKKSFIEMQTGRRFSEETKEKMRMSHTGYNMPNSQKNNISKALLNKKKSKEHSKNISLAKQGNKHPQFGKNRSEQEKRKISETLRKTSTLKKMVIRYSPKTQEKVEFESTMEAERQTEGANNSKICACANGKRKTHKGYLWYYKEE